MRLAAEFRAAREEAELDGAAPGLQDQILGFVDNLLHGRPAGGRPE